MRRDLKVSPPSSTASSVAQATGAGDTGPGGSFAWRSTYRTFNPCPPSRVRNLALMLGSRRVSLVRLPAPFRGVPPELNKPLPGMPGEGDGRQYETPRLPIGDATTNGGQPDGKQEWWRRSLDGDVRGSARHARSHARHLPGQGPAEDLFERRHEGGARRVGLRFIWTGCHPCAGPHRQPNGPARATVRYRTPQSRSKRKSSDTEGATRPTCA